MKSISPSLLNTWEYINRLKWSRSPQNETIESNIFNTVIFFNFKGKGKPLHLSMFETKRRFTSNFASVLLNMTEQWSIIFKVFGENVYYSVRVSDGEESACNEGDLRSVPRLGRSPGGGLGSPLQYSYLEKPMDRGTWQATVHGVAKSFTWLKQLSTTQHIVLVCEGNRICL